LIETLVHLKIEEFFKTPPLECGRLTNERSLQLELAYFFRLQGWKVRFEVPFQAPRLDNSTLRPKSNLDLHLDVGGVIVGIELKVPVNGQHPETIYSFCADLEFVEAIKRAAHINVGFCVMATNDSVFWTDSGRGSVIHNQFRSVGLSLKGLIAKPTGAKDSCVVLENVYSTAGTWAEVSEQLFHRGKYLAIPI
jgi:hypothetical protein